MRLSPRDPKMGLWHDFMAGTKLDLGHFDAAIEGSSKAIDAGYKVFWPYLRLASMRSKATSTKRRRRWPKLAASIPSSASNI